MTAENSLGNGGEREPIEARPPERVRDVRLPAASDGGDGGDGGGDGGACDSGCGDTGCDCCINVKR